MIAKQGESDGPSAWTPHFSRRSALAVFSGQVSLSLRDARDRIFPAVRFPSDRDDEGGFLPPKPWLPPRTHSPFYRYRFEDF